MGKFKGNPQIHKNIRKIKIETLQEIQNKYTKNTRWARREIQTKYTKNTK